MMKYLTLLLLFFSVLGNACIVGPREIPKEKAVEFLIETKENQFEDCCKDVSVTVPLYYEEVPFAYAFLTVYMDSKLISKTAMDSYGSSKQPEFYAMLSNEEGVSYEIEMLYGSGRCSAYKFVYQSAASGA